MPMGDIISMARLVMFSSALMSRSSLSWSGGNSGVKVLEQNLVLGHFGRIAVDSVELDQREIASSSFGMRIAPSTVSPVCRLKRRI